MTYYPLFLLRDYGIMNKPGRAYYSTNSKQGNKLAPLKNDKELKMVVVCYDNAKLAKSQILAENQGRAGVYR